MRGLVATGLALSVLFATGPATAAPATAGAAPGRALGAAPGLALGAAPGLALGAAPGAAVCERRDGIAVGD